jgi:glycosyltransferase involved in cell wall biosynthesis
MRIAVDALGIHYYGGGRTATLNLFEALLAMDDKNEYLFFLTNPEPSLISHEGKASQYIAPVKNRFLVRVWAQVVIPIIARNFDLIHFSKHLGVFGISTPYVVTIYDMTTLVHPEIFPTIDVWYWRTLQKRTLTNASRIIAISNNTANDIHRIYNLAEDKVRVIFPAIAERFRPIPSELATNVLDTYNVPESYIIHVGRIDKKKNLTLLVKAFARYLDRTSSETNLVLVGEDYSKSADKELRPVIKQLGLEQHVIFTGRVPDKDLPALYSGALATVFPSVHEGFGLAPIEAMACGCPVIGHRAGAFKEVAGNAALILDSIGEETLSEGLSQIINDPQLRSELKENGYERAAKFKPELTATQTKQLYEEVIVS